MHDLDRSLSEIRGH